MTTAAFRKLALAFPSTEEHPHFERAAFKVTGKRIFATMLESDSLVNMVLTTDAQHDFCAVTEYIYPVPNKWGQKGWTTFEIKHLDADVIQQALSSAYSEVMQPKPKRKR
ncbi:MmcQ/YjbR family DNA-binding protein [Chryseolinea sp. T2]|uniref:MmcQ/YjbR family DNA-binding protein n=1 Tax=Chryseolinea sp. T2 TaxID=3129255 RepID=UPI003078188B